jgi:hypothetical protein
MAHFPKPFFKRSRGVWYVEIDRRQHNLGPDRDEAFRQYYQLMGQPRERKVSPQSLAAIIDAYLEWVVSPAIQPGSSKSWLNSGFDQLVAPSRP